MVIENIVETPYRKGLKKNQKLDENMITPTTKDENHDMPISPEAIVNDGWMTSEDWNFCSQKAMLTFLILVKGQPLKMA